MGAAGLDGEAARAHRLQPLGPRLVAAVDEVQAHQLVGARERHLALPGGGDRQPRRADVGAAALHLGEDRGRRRQRHEPYRHAELAREARGEVEFRALGPAGAEVVGGGAVAGRDLEDAEDAHLLKHARPRAAGAEQPGREQRERRLPRQAARRARRGIVRGAGRARHWCRIPAAGPATGAAERWQSGRMYLTRNQAWAYAHRGFESHPLRHLLSYTAMHAASRPARRAP